MTAHVVFRSHEALAVAACSRHGLLTRDYIDRTNRVLSTAALAGYVVARGRQGWWYGEVLGLELKPRQRLPQGWRRNARLAEPDESTPAGREICARLAAIPHPGEPGDVLPGMPGDVIGPEHVHWPGIRLLERRTAVFVAWDIDPRTATGSFMGNFCRIDPALWTQVSLNVYCSAVRAARAARAGVAT